MDGKKSWADKIMLIVLMVALSASIFWIAYSYNKQYEELSRRIDYLFEDSVIGEFETQEGDPYNVTAGQYLRNILSNQLSNQ